LPKMKIFIVGIGGGVGRRLAEKLLAGKDEPSGIVRSPEQATELASLGIQTVIGDIVTMSVNELATAVAGSDVILFSAGAGGKDGNAATTRIDGEGPAKLAAAATLAGVSRFILVSVFPEAWRDRNMDRDFEHYMVEKKKAETQLTQTELDWVILRPAALNNSNGTGNVDLGMAKTHVEISRDDVAATLVAIIHRPSLRKVILEVTAGDVAVDVAVSNIQNSLDDRASTSKSK
jgi:uncharacterized protein YbjT (DUF2867 family)